MKLRKSLIGGIIVFAVAGLPAWAASLGDVTGAPVQTVITVRPAKAGSAPKILEPGELTVLEGDTAVRVISVEPLSGDLADMQLFICLDDSTRSSSLGEHIAELKRFLESLPPTAQVAVGYMRNGSFAPAQFTTDHAKVAESLRAPLAIPGINGSPYFALSELVKHWPSKQPAKRKAVLMLTDGVDPYYGTSIFEDPYVDAASRDALKQGVSAYAIYLRGAGAYGQNEWVTNTAQSRLMELSRETGGFAYFQDFTDPVTITPFVNDLQDRLANQYRVTIAALNKKGLQPVRFRTELPGLKIEAPTRIFVP